MSKEVYYGDYLELGKILDAQHPESDKLGIEAHDEMLFIIIHQAYELWFKQIIYELKSAKKIFSQNTINDNSPDLNTVVHRMNRVCKILEVAVHQISIMETMTPLDFLDFRNLLRPASGFQSIQFKMVEAMLGLKQENRHGLEYYLSQLRPEHIKMVKEIEEQRSLIEEVNSWLERMPFLEDDTFWKSYKGSNGSFWDDYRHRYRESLVTGEQENIERFNNIFFDEEFGKTRRFSPKANRAALFIMLFRDLPLLQLPYRLLNHLLDIDELLSQWRYRHMNMVHRMIGTRVGTGGSSGKDYLKAALDKHYIFKEIAELTSFLIERRNLPELPDELIKRIGFVH
ncbi:MAG TPA: tryptophan 2,3-dioxygenase family protein [Bacteroidia bacterium]|nr:tryptophan 2,3-dioxygenase family protein [Bacteroidia bacterium]